MNYLWETIKRYPTIPSFALWRAVELRVLNKGTGRLDRPLLDLGCGDGSFGSLFFTDTKVDEGIDNDRDSVELASKVSVYEKVRLMDACSMSFPDEGFKTVFSNCVFEHIPCYKDAVKEVYRVLQRHGMFVLTVPSENYHRYLYHYKNYIRMGREDKAQEYIKKNDLRHAHYYYMSPEQWRELLSGTGFKEIEISYYLPEETFSTWDRIEELFTREFFTMLNSYRTRALSLIPTTVSKILWFLYLKKHYLSDVQPGDKGAALLIRCRKER
ncbi:MAG: class I SAM-dependent methyltransferase [Deltaproteobacteria bacterium]|nr:class I SAM-dependent methyltransferase [Deltaproteobacteria bacterium]MCL5277427.1 class I SAM-dependent methyltransferase [Deltaproteobacteria bacterium]